MKKAILLIIVLFLGVSAYAQNNVYGKKVVGLDSLVSDTIRARTQAAPYIEGFGTGVGGSNTEIQFNDNGVFGASSDLTWDGTGLSVANGDFFADGDSVIINNLKFRGSSIESSNNTLFIESLDILDMREEVTAGEKYFTLGESSSYFRLGSKGIDYNEDGNYAYWRTGGANDTTYQLTIEGSDFSISNAPLKVTTFQNNSGTDVGSNRLYLQRFYNGSTLLQTWEDDGSIDFESNTLTDIGTTDTDSLYVSGNADVDGTLDVGSTATFAGEVTVEGGVIDLSNGGTNGKSALNSSLGRSQIYVSNDNTGAAPFDQKGSIIIQPRSDAAGRSVAIATGSVGSEAVAVLVQGNQNTEFSGDVIASSGDIYLGASSPALTISGGSNASSGGQIQLNGEGAGAADDIIFKASGTEVGRWDESASQWKFLNSLDVSGALSKGSGTFKITHPLDTSKWLYHSFVEAPRADNIYRGKVELYQGAAMVGIDTASNMTVGTFDSLNHNVQVFISNNDTWDLVKGSYSNGVLSIESQNVLSHAVVDWLVIGERKDQTVIDWDLTDDQGQLIPEWDKN